MNSRPATPPAIRRAALESLEQRTLLAGGVLDPTFGSGGKVETSFPNTAFSAARDAALQSDGKIIVLTDDNEPGRARLARFTAGGQPDSTFGSGGSVVLPFRPGAFAVRPDNRIVVAGYDLANSDNVLLARYTASGQVDSTFGGGDGQVSQPYFGGDQTGQKTITRLVIRPDDSRMFLAGDADPFDSGLTQFALSSYLESGDPNPQFGDQFSNGVLTEFGYTNHLADALLTPDGHIIAAGTLTVSDSHHPNVQQDFAVARYDEHGLRDNSFSGDGKLLIDFGDYPRNDPNSETDDAFDFAQSAALDSAGNLLVAGYSRDPTDDDPFYTALARVKPNGDLDPTFGPGGADGDGRVSLSLTAKVFTPNDVAALPTGKILVAAATQGATDIDFALARLNADGSLDTSFGTGGKVTTDFDADDLPNQLLLQSGKAILAGSSTNVTNPPGPSSSALAMARYTIEDVNQQTPFGGTPLSIPGTLQFENFDEGGEGVAYHDLDSANLGGAYRNTAVDIQPIPASSGGGNTLAFAKAGEWTEYTFNVPAGQSGQYDVALRIASLRGGGTFHLKIDGQRITSSLTAPNTADWQKYTTLKIGPIDLSAGTHVLRLAMDANDSIGYVANFDSAAFTRSGSRSPFKGTPFLPNQTIEAEDFDNGGEGLAYHDVDTANLGGVYRPGEGVDLQPAGDTGGGYNVGFAKAGEWLVYSLDIPTSMAQTYAIQVRVASLRGGGRFHLEIDGKNVAGFTAPSTGDWQKYTTLTSARNIPLSAGAHTLRLVMDTEDSTHYVANFNWMKLLP
jgi:uncharacterized delta-60 repeat protein